MMLYRLNRLCRELLTIVLLEMKTEGYWGLLKHSPEVYSVTDAYLEAIIWYICYFQRSNTTLLSFSTEWKHIPDFLCLPQCYQVCMT